MVAQSGNEKGLPSVYRDMKRTLAAAIGLTFASALFSAYTDYLSAKRKFELIETDKARPGSQVTLTASELNAWVREQAGAFAPDGVRDTKVLLGNDSATGSALIDFGKIRRAQGKSPNWLMSRLLDGERPVRVAARISSSGGKAQVDVQSVEVSGVQIDGRMLDFLIDYYVRPNFPSAKIGQPFELGHRIERLDVKPAAVAVVMRQ